GARRSRGRRVRRAGGVLRVILARSWWGEGGRRGYRGVQVTLGKVSPVFKPEGFGFKMPFITAVIPQSIRQQTAKFEADCYSSDLQQVKIDVRVLYRVPQASVVSIFREYAGDPFQTLIKPRVAEAIKELTALRSAEVIVQ